MKIVVAGGTGFLGRPLCAALAADGHEITILTRGVAAPDVARRLVAADLEPVVLRGEEARRAQSRGR